MPRERFSHSATMVGTTMVVFGGLNNDNFVNANVYAIEMDPFNSKRSAQDELIKRN